MLRAPVCGRHLKPALSLGCDAARNERFWRMRILVIEDDPVLSDGLRAGLRMLRAPASHQPASDRPRVALPVLVARSRGAPISNLGGTQTGFSERQIEGESWRVFTLEDTDKGLRVLVGDRLGAREHIVTDIIKGLLAPTLLIVPLLGFLIWSSLNRGLRPLRSLALELQKRQADDMRPVETGRAPAEILPMMDALNALFSKVESARRHEREITAFAAHELRTPLAGLRTQAQVAIGT